VKDIDDREAPIIVPIDIPTIAASLGVQHQVHAVIHQRLPS
jgi:hypothetical protein